MARRTWDLKAVGSNPSVGNNYCSFCNFRLLRIFLSSTKSIKLKSTRTIHQANALFSQGIKVRKTRCTVTLVQTTEYHDDDALLLKLEDKTNGRRGETRGPDDFGVHSLAIHIRHDCPSTLQTRMQQNCQKLTIILHVTPHCIDVSQPQSTRSKV